MHDDSWSGSHEDAYVVLGVPSNAEDAEIAAAYRGLARRHHPDVAGESETIRMSRINAAFDRLRDPHRREAYDRELDELDRAAGRPGLRIARRRTRAAYGHGPRNGHGTGSSPGTGNGHAPPRQPSARETERDGTGGAGLPPGRPSGTVLAFGRHIGWSIGEVARVDPGYLEWLERRPEGRRLAEEIDATLRRIGFRTDQNAPRTNPDGNRFRRFSWR